MKFNKMECVTDYKKIQIRETKIDGTYSRRVLTPDMKIAEDEHQEVKDKAEAEWTDAVKIAWATYQSEQKALNSLEALSVEAIL